MTHTGMTIDRHARAYKYEVSKKVLGYGFWFRVAGGESVVRVLGLGFRGVGFRGLGCEAGGKPLV